MKLGHVEIFVSDPLKSKIFYEEVLGFDLVAVQGDQFVWLKKGDIEILLRPGKNGAKPKDYQQAGMSLVLYTDALEPTMRDLEARGLVFDGDDNSPLCPTFTDMDGNWFMLVDPNNH
jgi:catechol 2,3-dioxygenase-like lactoylglutathione lyase family enzyme